MRGVGSAVGGTSNGSAALDRHGTGAVREPHTLAVRPKAVRLIRGPVVGRLWGVLGVLLLLHAFFMAVALSLGPDDPRSRMAGRLFDLDAEGTMAVWFSSGMLAFAAAILLFIAMAEREVPGGAPRRWAGLSAVFAYLSIDEAISIHEHLTRPMRAVLGPRFRLGGVLHHAWVAPAMLAVGVLVAVYLPLLRRLPRPTARMFVIAGAVFIGGAVGWEVIGGLVELSGPASTPGRMGTLMVCAAMEETMEMAGVVLFIDALLGYCGRRGFSLQVAIAPGVL